MVKVLAPIRLKDSVRLNFMESMAVRIPTSAMIPKAMIITVRIVRNKFVLIDFIAILTFSINMALFINLIFTHNKNIKI
jgi:hypothetical protein